MYFKSSLTFLIKHNNYVQFNIALYKKKEFKRK